MIIKPSRILLLASALVLIGLWTAPLRARAYDPFGTVCSNNAAQGSTVCTGKGNGGTNPLVGPNGVIRKIANITALMAGIVGVIMLILAGLTFIMAGGEAGKVKQAQEIAKYTILGLVVIAVADSIISYIVSRL